MPPSPRRDSLAPPTSSPTSTRAAAAANTPQSPRTRYQSGHVLDHVDSYILRGEDMTHSPGESRLPSPVPSIRGGDEREATGRREEDAEERTLTSGSGNGSVGRDGLDEAEKGLRSRKGAPTEEAEKRASRNSSDGEKSADPATRRWKNDVVTFDSKDDLANPKNWSFRRRYFLVALLGLTTMCSTFASSIFSTATPAVAAEFGVSTEVATLGTSLFLAGFILGPIIFGPLSEVYGRKTIFIGTFAFICFSAGTATAKDLQTIMLTRFWAGVGASAAPSVVGGALADLFDARERATAVVFYSLAIVAGPTVSPVIGSAVTVSYLGWRWTEYLVVILSSCVGLIAVVVVPETFAPVILTRKAKKLRFETKRWALHSKHEENDFSLKHFAEKTLTRPLLMLLKEPMVTAICTYNSFTYGTLYLLFSSVPIIFEEGHGWTPVQTSLVFLAVLVGTLIAAFINYLYSRFVFARHVDKYGTAPPEMRLPPMMLGGIFFPVGFFLLGWAPAAGKIVGLAFVGVAFLLIFQAGINYLIDAYTQYSASAVASNTFLRSIFAAALPLVAMPLFHNLGVGFACTLLGCIAAALGVVPFAFYRFGPKLRSMSSYAKA